MKLLNRQKTQINLIEDSSLDYYQNEAGFFCLSDICKDYKLKAIDFLNFKLTKYFLISEILINKDEIEPPKDNLTIESFIKHYPQLAKYSRVNNSLSSGLWLHSVFLKPLEIWLDEKLQRNWDKYLTPEESYNCRLDAGISKYRFNNEQPWKKPKCVSIREKDGFVLWSNISKIKDLLSDFKFVFALEKVRIEQATGISENIIIDLLNNWELAIFESYRSLFKIIKIGKEIQVWIHPEVMEIYDRQNPETIAAIADWKNRYHSVQPDPYVSEVVDCYIDYCSKKKPIIEQLASNQHYVDIFEYNWDIYFRVTSKNLDWEYFYNLKSKRIALPNEILTASGLLRKEEESSRSLLPPCLFESETTGTSNIEVTEIAKSTDSLDSTSQTGKSWIKILDITTVKDSCFFVVHYASSEKTINLYQDIAASLTLVDSFCKEHFTDCDLDSIRGNLENLGYRCYFTSAKSPHLSLVNTSSEIKAVWTINGVQI